LCLPVVGVADAPCSSQMTDVLLQAIAEKRCAAPSSTSPASRSWTPRPSISSAWPRRRLLGAQCLLTGVSPNIAHTMVHMGVTLTDITTHRSLREALRSYVLGRVAR
jgi:rsbT co-antagonist protein RsbR